MPATWRQATSIAGEPGRAEGDGDPLAYVCGEFVAQSAAVVSIDDRGFRYGDGLFETVRVEHGVAYQWPLHYQRLRRGLRQIAIPAPPLAALTAVVEQLLVRNRLHRTMLRIAVSRGRGSRGYLPDADSEPTVVVECLPLPAPVPAPATAAPVRLWASKWRRPATNALPAGIKTMQGLASTLARLEAAANNCDEALMLGPHGELCETSSANLFWTHGNVLCTPDTQLPLVTGTIRDAVMRVGVRDVHTGIYSLRDLESADEVLLTNAGWLVRSVVALLPGPLRWPRGPVATALHEALVRDIADYAAAHPSPVG